MVCVAVTRGGSGDLWRFPSLQAADEHALVQYGDALCCGPGDLCSQFRDDELSALALRAGDERLSRVSREMLSVDRVGVARQIWELMQRAAQAVPSSAEEILRRVAEDRRATRASGVTVRSGPNKERVMSEESTTKRSPPPRTAKFSDTSVITLGKDKEGRAYGPENNPKRAGSAAANRFVHYRDGMTVKDAMDAGATRADINWDAKQGFIVIQ